MTNTIHNAVSTPRWAGLRLLGIVGIALAGFGCSSDRIADDRRNQYIHSLKSGHQDATLATRWAVAGDHAILMPVSIELPYVEDQSLVGAATNAVVLAFDLTSLQTLEVSVNAGPGAVGGLIVDLLRQTEEGWESLGSIGTAERFLEYVPSEPGRFAVRAQPVFGSMGTFGLALMPRTPLRFPVETDSSRSVLSYFGDARDGGTRTHKGIDIFAPRGTPVVAAADGKVTSVARSPRGGLHVWQESAKGRLYYAHLDSAAVQPGTIRKGDLIGSVGNSGNARTTSPHLHFGVYSERRHPVDPLPLVGTRRPVQPWTLPPGVTPPVLAIDADTLNLRIRPSTGARVLHQLVRNELVMVRATSGSWLRVRTGEGFHGFIHSDYVRPPQFSRGTLAADATLYQSPDARSPKMIAIRSGEAIFGAGRFGRFRWIETASGVRGWVWSVEA